MKKIGYTHGRFQPLHKGHLSVLLYILDNYEQLWVGISNPLRRLPPNVESYNDELKISIKKARQDYKNIFTFFERKQMILETLKDEGVDLSRVHIYPHFGFYEEKNWTDFMPSKEKTTVVLHCKDVHHNEKVDQYIKLGWKTEAIPMLKTGYSGTQFHEEYPNGNWKELVPDGTKKVLENLSKN